MYVSLATGEPLAVQVSLSCLLQAVVEQDVKLPSVSRLEGQLLEAPAAAADPTPEAPLALGIVLPSCPYITALVPCVESLLLLLLLI